MGKVPQFAVHSISFVPGVDAGRPGPDPGAGPRHAHRLPLGPQLHVDVRGTCGGKTRRTICAPARRSGAQALRRAVRDAAAKGFAGFAGVEPEFIVMRWHDGRPVKAFDNDPLPGEGVRPRRQAFGYDVEYSIDSMEFLGSLIDILEELGWGLKDVVAEGAYSQFELDFTYTDVLGMADRLVFLRVLLKEVAKQHGMVRDLHAEADRRRLARTCSRAPGGAGQPPCTTPSGDCCATAAHSPPSPAPRSIPITVFVSRVGGFEGGTVTWAPTHMTYGSNNRSCMLCLPQNRFCIENRATDMCMNPYLSLALNDRSDGRRGGRGHRSGPTPQQGPLRALGRGNPRRRRPGACRGTCWRRPRPCGRIGWQPRCSVPPCWTPGCATRRTSGSATTRR